jgi:DEAD/DEAH box helicase domain-containing protein
MIAEALSRLQSAPGYVGQITHVEMLPAREATYETLERALPPSIEEMLARRGLVGFYTHQARAIDAARAGENVMVATGTASGKTLCYNVPVLEAILDDPMARALYLFPTKALAQDQARALSELVAGSALAGLRYGVYDGDTEPGGRTRLRRHASIILSNPDMLNAGILPNHSAWTTFIHHLRYVVLDEAHVYRGIFGSHVALLIRRLRRIAQAYGAEPQFILCSATIANGGSHAERVTGEPVTLVDSDGSPAGPRRFVLWNPPLTDPALGTRHSINAEAADIMATLVREGIRNITFVRARRLAELIFLYARDALQKDSPELAERIAPYRAGYLPAERRRIEARLFSGELLAVTATNALELGIDVGHLDATVLVGYPGTIASTWQQAGRAGRGSDESLTIMLGYSNPLDQYFVRHPQELFQRSPENALIDPANVRLLRAHLQCAAYEAPLTERDFALFGTASRAVLGQLVLDGLLEEREERWFYPWEDRPAGRVNLRGAEGDPFLLLDTSRDNEMLEELDAAAALFRVHPGAVHLHQGRSYLITGLDLNHRVALAEPTEVPYYTQPIEDNQVEVIRSTRSRVDLAVPVFLGQVRVTVQVLGYREHEQFTGATRGEHELDLPPQSYETQALWFGLPADARRTVLAEGLDLAGGLHAVEHAVIGMLPLFAMCDRNDIGGVSTLVHPDTGEAEVFVYDAYPGGVGIAEKGYELARELWERTLALVSECPCAEGCPSCIQSPKCGNNNEPLDKAAAVLVLRSLLAN